MRADRDRTSERKQLELRRESLRVLSSEELSEVVGARQGTPVPRPTAHISAQCHTTT